jgi:hypothetical protein
MSQLDKARINDAISVAMDMGRGFASGLGLVGYGVAILTDDRTGRLKQVEPFANLITTAGDEYYAKRSAAAIGTPNLAQPTLTNGMKLGSASTNAAVKSNVAGADLDAYIATSNKLFDTTHPSVAAVGADGGWNLVYKCTWPSAGLVNSNIVEVVLVNDSATDATSTVANTYARAIITAVNKTTNDSLAITWTHKFLGA